MWTADPDLEATSDLDATELDVAGRTTWVDFDRQLVAGGTVVLHRERRLLMNPYVWLTSTERPSS